MRQRVSCGEAPHEWHRADGTTVACTEKVKVLNENWQEIRAMLQDAMDDAVLMGCTEKQFREEYTRLVASITSDYAEQKAQTRPAEDFAVLKTDHIVLTVADLDASITFYTKALGMKAVTFGAGRKALLFAGGKINLHEAAGEPILPRAKTPQAGSSDLCFLVNKTPEETVETLPACGISVEEGPVRRTGAYFPLTSVYVRDPDGNLIELAVEAEDD